MRLLPKIWHRSVGLTFRIQHSDPRKLTIQNFAETLSKYHVLGQKGVSIKILLPPSIYYNWSFPRRIALPKDSESILRTIPFQSLMNERALSSW